MRVRRWLAALLELVLAAQFAALGEGAARTEVELSDALAAQAQVDAALVAEAEAGYAFESPLVVVNPYGGAPLSALAIFTTEEEIGGAVTAKGKAPEDDVTGSFPAARVHYVPIYGLYPGEATDVELRLDDGRTVDLRVETEALPLTCADFRAEMLDADAYDFSQLNIACLIRERGYVGFDSKGDARWALLNTGFQGKALLENGRMLIPTAERYSYMNWWANGLREVDGLGRTYAEYIYPGGTHHDLMRLPSGNYLAVGDTPGEIDSEDYLVEIDADTGEVVWDLDLDALFARDDGGAAGQTQNDWAHINSVCYDEEADLLIVSCRHLGAVVGIRKAEKELAWVLSDPAGWEKLDPSLLLTPVGEAFEWPYGQHEVSLLSDGTLLMFDNGYGGRAKLPNAEQALDAAQNYSRAVRYRIDPEAMTVEQVWEYGRELGARYFSDSRSGVECLDLASDTYFIDFGICNTNFDGSLDSNAICTYLQYIRGGERIWELYYTGMTYRAFRGDPYDFCGNFDLSEEARRFGTMGECAARIESMDVDASAARPLELPLEIRRLPYGALRVAGTQTVAAPASELGSYAAVFVNSDGEAVAYELFHYSADGEAEETLVNLDGWIPLQSLAEGSYGLYLMLNGELYDTGEDVRI